MERRPLNHSIQANNEGNMLIIDLLEERREITTIKGVGVNKKD